MPASTKRRKPSRKKLDHATLPARERREDRALRAAACAAFHIFTASRRHNPNRPENYVTSVCHLLYALLRAGFPRVLPVPKSWNRSGISEAENRFDKRFAEELARIERQATGKRRPTQPNTVTQALGMLPRARAGMGPLRAENFFSNLPPGFRPIHELMSVGIELAWLRERYKHLTKPK